ncbi:hypothetical protein ScPMuIL_015319 [Solemya velum]
MSAFRIFALSIEYLKDNMLEMSMKQAAGLKQSDIYWVLTTPAIWSESAKQFMREAAIEAGIDNDSLTIALEPEAASIYCRYAKLLRGQSETSQSVDCFAPGTRYAVLDAGGGTVDITIHEVNEDSTLKEIHRANGGPWGGTMVDEEFFNFLNKTVGANIMHIFRNEYMEDYLNLVRSFELKKRTISPTSTNPVTLGVPYALRKLFENHYGESVEKVFEHMDIDEKITWKDDKLKFTADAMKQFVEKPLLKIVEHMRTLLDKGNMSVSHVLMVGGFSESPMLQHSIMSGLGSCTVLVPPQASLAVLRGAVIFGHDPSCITHRVCRFTYGTDACRPFIAGKHDEKRKVLGEDNVYRCKGCFDKHVEIGQSVRCGEWQEEQGYLPARSSQTTVIFNIYASPNKNPQYVDEPGCIKLGHVRLPLPDTTGGLDRPMGFKMCFSGTSLSVKARNKKTDETIECSASPERAVVAAIDVGTTHSWYAFSFRYQYDKDPTDTSGSLLNQSLKTPTCILLNSEQEFSAFGSDAEDKYAELASDNKHKDWYYFKHFKMRLHDEEGLRNLELEDATGKTMSAFRIFALSIEYLKDNMLEISMKQVAGLKQSDIYWVLTTPAIWSENAKQFMREAAIEAGIDKDSLTIALEPEAASIYCRYAKLLMGQSETKQSIGCFAPGTRYAVLDAGGGTVDITIHEVNEDGTLKEIHRANGGPWGGTMVDEEFFNFLNKTVGANIMHIFRNDYMEDYLNLVRSFELKKRTIGPTSTNQVTLGVPYALRKLFENHSGESVEKVFEHMDIDEKITWKDDKLKFTADAMKQFFEKPLLKIVEHMRTLLDKGKISVSHVLMVGGFSESPMLQHSILSGLGSCTVLVPPQASLAVLRGAVIFGHVPSCITHRVCRFTYGTDACRPFIAGEHDEKRNVLDEDNVYGCEDCFDKHVEIGQSVRCGEWQEEQEYTPAISSQTGMSFDIYASTNKNPQYVDEPGCIKVGHVRLPLPDTTGGLDRPVGFQMCHSGTSLSVKARNKKTDETIECSVDFLG